MRDGEILLCQYIASQSCVRRADGFATTGREKLIQRGAGAGLTKKSPKF